MKLTPLHSSTPTLFRLSKGDPRAAADVRERTLARAGRIVMHFIMSLSSGSLEVDGFCFDWEE